jgi:hypothetical protein
MRESATAIADHLAPADSRFAAKIHRESTGISIQSFVANRQMYFVRVQPTIGLPFQICSLGFLI